MTHMIRYAITASVNFLHKLQLSNYKAVSATDFTVQHTNLNCPCIPFQELHVMITNTAFFKSQVEKFVKLQRSKLELLIVYV